MKRPKALTQQEQRCIHKLLRRRAKVLSGTVDMHQIDEQLARHGVFPWRCDNARR